MSARAFLCAAENNMRIQFQRQINTNRWMIKARWLYAATVLFIGYLTKAISLSNVNFPMELMILLCAAYLVVNSACIYFLHIIEKRNSQRDLNLFSYVQIGMELIVTTIIIHFGGGIESIALIFFFLPIVMSALIFQARGAIITAVVTSLIINFLTLAEYYGIIPHVARYSADTMEFLNLSIALTKTISYSLIYLVIGFYVGYGANTLHAQEELYEEKVKLLDVQTKKLQARELELESANRERDKRVQDLENFKNQVVGRELDMIELKKKIEKFEKSQKV